MVSWFKRKKGSTKDSATKSLRIELKKAYVDPKKSTSDTHLLLNQIADAYMQEGDTKQALKYYTELAASYEKSGFNNKAVAIYKKALALNPNDPELLEIIAGFNQRVPKFMVKTQLAQDMKSKSMQIKQGRS